MTLGVAARTATSISDYSAAVVPAGQVDPDVLTDAPTRAMVTVTDGVDPAVVRRSLVAAGYADTTTTAAWAAGDQAASADLNRGLVLGLAGLGALYALIAVINAVALAAAARKREFAVARVTGLSREQVIRTSVLESFGVGVIGVALGGAAAAVCLVSVRRGFATLLGEPVVVVPWAALGGLTAVSLAAVTTTAGLGAWWATRTPPITLVAAKE